MHALLDAIAQMPLPQEACRLFHGRGGRFPGCEAWTLDAYPPALVFTSFAPVDAAVLQALEQALIVRWAQIAPGQPLTWVLQLRGKAQAALAPGEPATRLMAGKLSEPYVVTEAGARYRVQLLRGQNHGLFLDMAAGRQWLADRVHERPGGKVLNLFAYSCAFSVVALRAGAHEVVNVDMARGALALGRENHRLNGVEAGAQFWAHDIFSSWAKIGRAGPFDVVVVDPPSYQKGSFVAAKDWGRVLRRLPGLLAPGGRALLCLNAPELGSGFLHQQVAEHAPALVVEQRVANPAVFADVDEERSLKVLACRLR